jgi:AraC family transcriptional activator of pobA
MPPMSSLPLFHLYGDPPEEDAFDFIHVETIVSRSSIHDWTIRAHRHRNLFQILVIQAGGGTMTLEEAQSGFDAPSAIVLQPNVVHGFRFRPNVTDGFVVSFTEDVAYALGDRSRGALARLRSFAADPVIALADAAETDRLISLCRDLQQEHFLAREGHRLALRALLALLALEVVRLAASRARTGAVTLAPSNPTVDALRDLIDAHFRTERQLDFYADKLVMTADRLNDLVKRASGVTAGHLIRQRLLTEAKRELMFTNRAINDIAYDLAFVDPSHFARFFRKQTKMTPQEFRRGRAD